MCCPKKKFWTKRKTITTPFKLNGRSLMINRLQQDGYLGGSKSVQVVFLYCLYLHHIELPFNIKRGLESHSLVRALWSWSYGSWIYNYLYNQLLSPLKLWVQIPFSRGVLATTLCDKVRQWLATGRWFSLGIPVSSTNKTDRHDITEILLKVALNTITPHPLRCIKESILYNRFMVY